MTKRDELLDWAKSQIGPGNRVGYWMSAMGKDPGPKLAWCAAFCLAGLHAVGLAAGQKFVLGQGFVGPLKLKQTRTPSRGDIVYLDQPFQHHALFDYEHDGWVYSVDGNQPDVRQRRRRKEGLAFYSISPLLEVTDTGRETDPLPPPPNLSGVIRKVDEIEGGFVRGQKFSVPGIQDGLSSMMVVCSICDNKRCPRATSPAYKCTGSNDLNQVPELDE